MENPLLASFAALLTILLWVNLLGRVVLQMTAFMANAPVPEIPNSAEHIHAHETPNFITISAPHTLLWPHQRLTGSIDPDPANDPQRPTSPPQVPVWGGLIGWLYRWRIRRTQAKLRRLRASYYGTTV